MSKLIAYNARGWRIGEDHGRAKYTDHEVTLALDLRAAGLSYRAIAAALEVPAPTVRAWCLGLCRSEIPAQWRRNTPTLKPINKGIKKGG